ncbi:response regulator transcription factor [Aquisalibacillus elongatus]|uniref:Two-component system alkaline phosphatase synthesis response regulator PhoP n=1 Tax=Aquisalibacillus elongatus TaxID=485577 RepID=A0A3N5C1E0_9BACI|nr:response regulator transcription factor [Aquisalibacillus elongatus]RPF55898.1 two-component system alkaline phosphatase synthesis response regulator PhoP [Aquisalibacillus elongatus]
MDQTILVVEDDQMIRRLVKLYLEKNEYHVVEAADGEDAKEVFLHHQPCLIILDLMLPKVSGEEFCEWVRETEQDVSIIMLSAKAQVDDKISGLRMGADDYITKPFDPNELMAHVEAVLRRTGHYCQKITYDGLSIKVRKGEVLLNGEEIDLTKHEFSLLYFLMSNPNTVFTREQLLNQLYPNNEQDVLDRTIDAHIKKLRIKLNDKREPRRRIQTVRGMGYKFVP